MSEKPEEKHLDDHVKDVFTARVERNLKALIQAISESDEDRAALPEWVRNIQAHLNETIYGGLELELEKGLSDPHSIGLAVGHAKRARELIEEQLERISEHVDTSKYPQEVLTRLKEISDKFKSVVYPERDFDGFDVLASGFLNKAYYSWGYADAHKFFKGVSEGLYQLTGYGTDWKDQRANTPVLLHMFICWHIVEYEIENVPHLRKWLLNFFKVGQVGQDTKRLEKICERIKLRFAKRGRPRTLPRKEQRNNPTTKK